MGLLALMFISHREFFSFVYHILCAQEAISQVVMHLICGRVEFITRHLVHCNAVIIPFVGCRRRITCSQLDQWLFPIIASTLV